MSEFNQVTVARAANIYFDGNVTSRVVTFDDGSVKTLGIMMPGEYTFSTSKAELMEITSGVLRYRLDDESPWQKVVSGESFNVPANASFDVEVASLIDYCCSYLD